MVQLNQPNVQSVVLRHLLEDPTVQTLINDRNRVSLLSLYYQTKSKVCARKYVQQRVSVSNADLEFDFTGGI